jgi:hypothetical protein
MDLRLVKIFPKDSDRILTDAEVVESTIQQIDSTDSNIFLDLDESWSGIHFTLTGEYPIPKDEALKRDMKWYDDSMENILMGGSPTPYKDSLGFARYLSPEEVVQIAKYLINVSIEKFREYYCSDELVEAEILPGYWDEDSAWLVGYFEKLVNFYKTALEKGNGILIYAV